MLDNFTPEEREAFIQISANSDYAPATPNRASVSPDGKRRGQQNNDQSRNEQV